MSKRNVVRLTGSWIPPRKGNVIVNVVCTKAGERIAVVRVVGKEGPVLWYRGGIDPDESPGPAIPVTLQDAEEDFALWCPACGSTPIDIAALRFKSKQAAGSSRPHTFFV
jgi:hypothetical protein